MERIQVKYYDDVYVVEWDGSEASAPIYLDGRTTPFQTADARHESEEAIRLALGWEHGIYETVEDVEKDGRDANDPYVIIWEDVEYETIPDADEIIKAITDAQEGWTGLDWPAIESQTVYFPGTKEDDEGWEVELQFDAEGLDGDEDPEEILTDWIEKMFEDENEEGGVKYKGVPYGAWLSPKEAEKLQDAMLELIEQGVAYAKKVKTDAEWAQELGDKACSALKKNDFDSAKEYIEEAEALERAYGDSPIWGPVLRLFE